MITNILPISISSEINLKFSIIIPAWNAERFISLCLESVCNQKFNKALYEIIVVDDASPDNQNTIIESFIADPTLHKNVKIRLIKHAYNKKQGGARNTGIRVATGEWIIFLDSDDWWRSETILESLNNICEQASDRTEIIRCITHSLHTDAQYTNHESIFKPLFIETAKGSTIIKDKRYDKDFYVIWHSLFKRKFIIENNLWFEENMFYEDSDWTIRSLWNANEVNIYRFSFVEHRLREDSAASAKNKENLLDNIKSVILVDKCLDQLNVDDETIRVCRERILRSINGYMLTIRNYPFSSGVECLKFLSKSDVFSIQKYSLSFFNKIAFMTVKWIPSILVLTIKGLTITKRVTIKTLRFLKFGR